MNWRFRLANTLISSTKDSCCQFWRVFIVRFTTPALSTDFPCVRFPRHPVGSSRTHSLTLVRQ